MKTKQKQEAGQVAARVRGRLRLELIGPDGQTKQVVEKDNLVVNAGLNQLREMMFDSVSPTALTLYTHIAIGSGATAAALTDTALVSELARRAFDNYTAGGTGVATVDVTVPAGTGTGAITEAGIFDASSGGNMFNRVVFTSVNKTASDALKVSFTITFS